MGGLMCFDRLASIIAHNLPHRGKKWWNDQTRPSNQTLAHCQWWFMVDGYKQLTEDMWGGCNLEARLDSHLSDAEWEVVWKWKKDFGKILPDSRTHY